MKDHYKSLGIRRTATQNEVKAAYHHWAKQLHPDVNPSPDAAQRFLAVKEAYEALGDPASRRSYDSLLIYSERQEAQLREAEASQARIAFLRQQEAMEAEKRAAAAQAPPPSPSASEAQNRSRLQTLLSQSRLKDAEALARQMISANRREATAWAALGDIARQKGELVEAARCYAYAAQFDPRTPSYVDRHLEVTEALSSPTGRLSEDARSDPSQPDKAHWALGIYAGLCLLLFCWVVIQRIEFILPVGPLASWTMPLAVSLLVAGVGLGGCLSAGGFVDRLALSRKSALAKWPPAFVLGVLSLANFWLMAALYVTVGLVQNGFTRSLTALVAGSAATLVFFSAASLFVSPAMAFSCLLWGGAPIYAGALAGWAAADSLKALPMEGSQPPR